MDWALSFPTQESTLDAVGGFWGALAEAPARHEEMEVTWSGDGEAAWVHGMLRWLGQWGLGE